MEAIDILRKAVNRKHPCHPVHAAIDEIEDVIEDAVKFFSPHDFDGEKSDWLKRTGHMDLQPVVSP